MHPARALATGHSRSSCPAVTIDAASLRRRPSSSPSTTGLSGASKVHSNGAGWCAQTTANELVYDYASFFVISDSPTDKGINGIVSIAARADRVELYFNHGPQLPDPKKRLQGSGKLTRFIRVEAARQLAHPDVEAFIAAAIDHSGVPLPSEGKGSLIIKTNKMVGAKKPRRSP